MNRSLASKRRGRLLRRELSRIVRNITRRYRPEKIFLFGSLARGEVSAWSDIDLAVVKDTRKRFLDRIGDVLLCADPKVGLDAVVYTPQEIERLEHSGHYFWTEEIKNHGKLLYQRP